MTGDNERNSGGNGEPPIFAARLYPHRSLPRSGFIVLMVVATAACLCSGLLFAVAGAWPVSGFFGLDLALLALAFLVNYRSGRRFEEIGLWRHDLLVRKHSASGSIAEHHFNPFYARLKVERREPIGVTGLALTIGRSELAIGDFLNPPDRRSFAQAFGEALRKAR
jgi:uncharacterized membrane protein